MAGPKPAVLPITPRGSVAAKFSNSPQIPKEDIRRSATVRENFFDGRNLPSACYERGLLLGFSRFSVFPGLHRKCQSLQLTRQINIHHRDIMPEAQRRGREVEDPLDLILDQIS